VGRWLYVSIIMPSVTHPWYGGLVVRWPVPKQKKTLAILIDRLEN